MDATLLHSLSWATTVLKFKTFVCVPSLFGSFCEVLWLFIYLFTIHITFFFIIWREVLPGNFILQVSDCCFFMFFPGFSFCFINMGVH